MVEEKFIESRAGLIALESFLDRVKVGSKEDIERLLNSDEPRACERSPRLFRGHIGTLSR